MRLSPRVRAVCVASSLLVIALSACSSNGNSFCSGNTSVAGFTSQFSQGLDNFSEGEYSRLREEAMKVRDLVNYLAINNSSNAEASDLTKKLNIFVSSMDELNWDVSVALLNDAAVIAAATLGSASTLTQANTVESLLIGECGLPSTLVNDGQGVDTLPPPSIASPTQTDPPTNTINETSQDDALGATVATLFGLTLSPAQTGCLGASLQGVVDVSSGSANLAQYQSQFQKAFDACSIDFTVPLD
jgi:hypothetical protein